MTSRLRTRAAAAALALTAGLALAACSGEDDPKPDPTSASSDDGTDDPAGGALTQEDFASTVSAAMLESGSVHVDLDFGAAGASGEGDVAIG